MQVLGSVLTDTGLLMSEVTQRRTFLMENVARLGQSGAAWAASWPLGDVLGMHSCIALALHQVASLCLLWQIVQVFLLYY